MSLIIKPHLKKQWCIGCVTAEYLWRMEQVLDTYEQPYNSRRPVVCFDERPCQLLGDVLMPIPMKLGRIERQDYHYQRHGTCVVLMAVEPLAGRRIVKITEHKAKKDGSSPLSVHEFCDIMILFATIKIQIKIKGVISNLL